MDTTFSLKKTLSEWNALKASAKSGDSGSELEVAFGYEDGVINPQDDSIIVKKNPKRSIFWYKRAAEHGDSDAQNNLGVHISHGWGTKKDNQKALYWLRKAVRKNNASAAHNIALIYKEIENNNRALFWFKRAIKMGNPDSLLSLGECYYYGHGVRRNIDLALKYFTQTLENENICEATEKKAIDYIKEAGNV